MKNKFYIFLKLIIPPILFLTIKRVILLFKLGRLLSSNTPKWVKIINGDLANREILINKNTWPEMMSGNYDIELFNYLKQSDLKGQIIYDIGAHIGFSSMIFSTLVGENGKVIAFEPNIFNLKRFEIILNKNQDLKNKIIINNFAISDKNGEDDFIFSDTIDDGTSSGSFLWNSDTFYEKSTYEKNIGFKRTKVKIVSINNYLEENTGLIPAVIKIDIEGAEFLALKGGLESIKKHKIKLLIEIHSIFNMFKVEELLRSIDYKIKLLKEEKDGRCFIAAFHDENNTAT